MRYCIGQYFHFISGRNYIVSLLSYTVPEWRNGRRRGFKIPRLHGRVSSNLTLGTNFRILSLGCLYLVSFMVRVCGANVYAPSLLSEHDIFV